MSDTQFYVLVSTILAGLGAIRWSVGRIVKALDDNSTAMIANTKSNAVLTTKIDSIASYVKDRDTAPIRRKRSEPEG